MRRTWILSWSKTIQLVKRILTPQLLKSVYPIFTLLMIGAASFTAENLFTRAETPSCALSTAGTEDKSLKIDNSLTNDSVAQGVADGTTYGLVCTSQNISATPTTTNIILDPSDGKGDTTGKNIGNNPPNLCNGKLNDHPNKPLGPQGIPFSRQNPEYDNESDGSDVYCSLSTDPNSQPATPLSPPVNPYYQQSGNDNTFTTGGPFTKTNFDDYCQSVLGETQNPTGGAQRDGDTAADWKCHKTWNDSNGQGINMNLACKQQLSLNDPQARLAYYWSGNPEVWECLDGVKKLGNLSKSDIDPYCKDAGYQGGSTTEGSTAYDYFCLKSSSNKNVIQQNGNSVKFDTMLDVCEWLHKDYKYVIDVLFTYSDPTSWQCWGPNS